MRSLSFVDHLVFKDICTTSSRNLCLYDVDNDGDNELIIGYWDSGPLLENGEADAENAEGSIHVLKYKKVWKVSSHLGMVSCVTAGSIYKPGQTWIIALCADSHCYAFDACATVSDSECIPIKSVQKLQQSRGSLKSGHIAKPKINTLKMVHHQELAYNAKDVCIFNQGEIAVAYSDRVVRLYSWSSYETQKNSTKSSSASSSSSCPDSSSNLGEFILLIKWELAGQINRIDTCLTQKHGLMLIASQPSGGFAHLHRKFEKYHNNVAPTLTYYPPRVISSNNLQTRTWLVGNVMNNSSCTTTGDNDDKSTVEPDTTSSRLICLCTADGNMLLIDPTRDNDTDLVLWSIQVHTRSELFALGKIKLTQDDGDQIVVCSWDGATYIFDLNNNSVCFPLGQSCQAFIAGVYAVDAGVNVPVLIYSTFDHNIRIYYNLHLNYIAAQSLHSTILTDQLLVEKLQKKQVDPHNPVQLSEALRHILYELPEQTTHPHLCD
ncbi:unnamed protein product [Trichobilharzia szidati]|nr:unnamed protein product [Trichobilharzia szidati]